MLSKDISYLEPAICLVRLKKLQSSGKFLAPVRPLTSGITKWWRWRALKLTNLWTNSCDAFSFPDFFRRQESLSGCPRKNGEGKFWTFTDFPNFLSERQPLYPMNKYHIYLFNSIFCHICESVYQVTLKRPNLPPETRRFCRKCRALARRNSLSELIEYLTY